MFLWIFVVNVIAIKYSNKVSSYPVLPFSPHSMTRRNSHPIESATSRCVPRILYCIQLVIKLMKEGQGGLLMHVLPDSAILSISICSAQCWGGDINERGNLRMQLNCNIVEGMKEIQHSTKHSLKTNSSNVLDWYWISTACIIFL